VTRFGSPSKEAMFSLIHVRTARRSSKAWLPLAFGCPVPRKPVKHVYYIPPSFAIQSRDSLNIYETCTVSVLYVINPKIIFMEIKKKMIFYVVPIPQQYTLML
jgi:hypothetical protein